MNTPDVLDDIKAQYDASSKPTQILTFLIKKYGLELSNPAIGVKDIYNACQKMKHQELENMTPIQALNVALKNDDDWFIRNRLDSRGRGEYLFFINRSSMDILKSYGEVLIIDCIYKSNRYRMSLANMIGVIDLNTSFYAGMCFLKEENLEDYEWLIQAIKELYQHLDIPLPNVWLSDGEVNIPKTIVIKISSTVVHLLCVWHIDYNIMTNVRKHFAINEEWDRWFKSTRNWHKLLYAKTETEFDLQ